MNIFHADTGNICLDSTLWCQCTSLPVHSGSQTHSNKKKESCSVYIPTCPSRVTDTLHQEEGGLGLREDAFKITGAVSPTSRAEDDIWSHCGGHQRVGFHGIDPVNEDKSIHYYHIHHP